MLNEGGMNVSMQDTLQALADPTRREILNLLKQSRMSAGEISNFGCGSFQTPVCFEGS